MRGTRKRTVPAADRNTRRRAMTPDSISDLLALNELEVDLAAGVGEGLAQLVCKVVARLARGAARPVDDHR